MSVTVEKRPEGTPTRPVRSARWAWVAVAFSPLGVIVAVAVMFGIANIVGVDLWSTEPLTAAESAEIVGPTMVVGFACPALGVVLGVRSARSGNRSGLVAAIVAAAMLLPLATWWLLTAIQV